MNGHVKTNGVAKAPIQPGAELWRHPNPESTQMHEFLIRINKKYGKNFKTYNDLYRWSIDDISSFWSETWQYVGVKASKGYNKSISHDKIMFPRPQFFPGAELNFAENLLYPTQQVDPDSLALISANEVSREQVTWAQLRERVRKCQAGMIAADLQVGDRVGGFVANHTNALVAMLAATSLGAVWTAVSPDTGVTAVLDRMVQIEPKIFICDNAVIYNGKTHPTLPKVEEICASLPSVKKIVILETVSSFSINLEVPSFSGRATTYSGFSSAPAQESIVFKQLPPDHPIYILYSSGTTGKPKAIVHGAIGTLLQHKKEHVLHGDIRPGDRLFYYSSTTWMMWHWLVSGLAAGATLILYDGSPFRSPAPPSEPNTLSVPDDLAMPRLIDELQITQFGTSAKYLSILEGKSLYPKQSPHNLSLSSLKAIYSTGSPLAPSTFSYVYQAFGAINLGSITGGTDIISLFGAPCPLTPVYCGEIQVLGLGMAVQAWDYTGKDVSSTGEPGDLVCVRPFVCQPVTFWGVDGDKKYKASYFDMFEGVWAHGDFVRFNPATGGVYMLGRSDGILKPGGVRFGSAEIYNLVFEHFGKEVEDSLCIGRRRETDQDETVVLFLKMKEGERFEEELVQRVKAVVRKELSARHVPGIVVECPEIPVTVNGKKVENAVKQILCGLNVKTSASVANAECLEWYREWSRTHD
ncbi:AMP-binding enzyme-like protein 23 [Elsinoe fawcettii]|nr:AMP-binding enzyme-like protein 23 [Elsinoe fawcettii]